LKLIEELKKIVDDPESFYVKYLESMKSTGPETLNCAMKQIECGINTTHNILFIVEAFIFAEMEKQKK